MLSIILNNYKIIFVLKIKLMKLRHLTYFIILLSSCSLINKKKHNRNQDFIIKSQDNFSTKDAFIKIENGDMAFPDDDKISITKDTAYFIWAKHTQFGTDGKFLFGDMISARENDYHFDSAMYRWNIDTTSLVVTLFNSTSDSSVSYLYNTYDNGDGSYAHSKEEIINQ